MAARESDRYTNSKISINITLETYILGKNVVDRDKSKDRGGEVLLNKQLESERNAKRGFVSSQIPRETSTHTH